MEEITDEKLVERIASAINEINLDLSTLADRNINAEIVLSTVEPVPGIRKLSFVLNGAWKQLHRKLIYRV